MTVCEGCGKRKRVRCGFGMEHKGVKMCDDCWCFDALAAEAWVEEVTE